MNVRGARSALEEARLDFGSTTPGQRYTVGITVLALASVVLFGLPNGHVDVGSGLGAIPDLSARTIGSPVTPPAEMPDMAVAPLPLPAPAAPAPVVTPGSTGSTDGPRFAPAPTSPAGSSDPSPTTTTTEPSPVPTTPVPVPALPAS